MPRYELRLSLPDEPGSFGAVAVALGAVGANIVSFEAVEAGGGLAIDHIVLDLAPDGAAAVSEALEALPGTHVEAFRPVPQRPGLDTPLELIESLVVADPGQVLQVLVDMTPGTARVDWTVVLEERAPQPHRLAASVGAPSLVDAATPWLPLKDAMVVPVDEWVPRRWRLDPAQAAVAAAPLDATGTRALLAVRRHGPVFRQRELRVLAGMALVAGRLTGAGGDQPDT